MKFKLKGLILKRKLVRGPSMRSRGIQRKSLFQKVIGLVSSIKKEEEVVVEEAFEKSY
jgi:hypothetical protein